MSVVLHLSDLHLDPEASDREPILEALVDAVAADRRDRGREVDLVVVTGDIFDSANLEPARATAYFMDWLDRIHEALGEAHACVLLAAAASGCRGGALALPRAGARALVAARAGGDGHGRAGPSSASD